MSKVSVTDDGDETERDMERREEGGQRPIGTDAGLMAMLSSMSQTLLSVDSRMKGIDTKVRQLEGSVRQIDDSVRQVDGRQRQIEGRIMDISNEMEVVFAEQDDVRDRWARLSAELDDRRAEMRWAVEEVRESRQDRGEQTDPGGESETIVGQCPSAPYSAGPCQDEEEGASAGPMPDSRRSARLMGKPRPDYFHLDRLGFPSQAGYSTLDREGNREIEEGEARIVRPGGVLKQPEVARPLASPKTTPEFNLGQAFLSLSGRSGDREMLDPGARGLPPGSARPDAQATRSDEHHK